MRWLLLLLLLCGCDHQKDIQSKANKAAFDCVYTVKLRQGECPYCWIKICEPVRVTAIDMRTGFPYICPNCGQKLRNWD
jgi:hypothetical protein